MAEKQGKSMNFLGKLFGTDKAVDNLLDKDKGLLVRAGGWINDLNYTDAEKADNQLLVRQWGIKQLEALAPFKIVQRIIAFAVTSLWWVVGINVMIAIWVEAVWPDIQAREQMLQFAMSDYVFWPVLSVLSLYMGGGVLPNLFNRKKD
jgi:hypothetical protein